MSLHSLSNDRILSRTRRLVRYERVFTVRVLSHLNEIEERRLHLELGYRSMLDFCVRALGYARSSAGRRITAARCMKRFPEIELLLEANEVNVVTVAHVAGILTVENRVEVLGHIRGRTQEEVEAIVASCRPRAAVRDHVREILVPVARAGTCLTALSPAKRTPGAGPTLSAENRTPPADSSPALEPTPADPQSHCETEYKDDAAKCGPAPPAFEPRVVLKFAVSKPFMRKLRRFRSLAWHRLPANATMEQVFELLLDGALEREDPVAKSKRRARREKRRTEAAPADRKARPMELEAQPARREPDARRIPAHVRDAVFVRDGGACTFVGRGGRRCGSTDALQVDHIVPVARGGIAAIDNLRLLCAHHNRLEAERILGKQVRRPAARSSAW